jgi:alkyl hydroperoxide reductase subunit F
MSGDHEVTVYSTKACPHCVNLKAFLDKYSIPYKNIDVGTDAGAAQEMIKLTGQRSVPVTVLDGNIVIGYDPDMLSSYLGIEKTDVAGTHDLVIIGAGAAGLSAAMYAGRKGLDTLIIGGTRGGMAARTEIVENYPGFYRISGEALMNLFTDQSQSYGSVLHEDVVTGISGGDGMFTVDTLSGRQFTAKAVIAASGRIPRMSGVPGEAEFFGRGISVCATCDGPLYKDGRVAVYGGGNTAVDMAVELSGIAETVYLISRSPLTCDKITADTVGNIRNVHQFLGYVITKVSGGDRVSSITIAPRDSSEDSREIAVDGLFLGLGLNPNTAVFKGFVNLNEHGEIIVDENCRTNVPGFFAAGDATSIEGKQVAVAVGEGVKALLSAYRYLRP